MSFALVALQAGIMVHPIWRSAVITATRGVSSHAPQQARRFTTGLASLRPVIAHVSRSAPPLQHIPAAAAGSTSAEFSTQAASAKKKDRRRRRIEEAAPLPHLQHIIRKFYLKVHPDLFTHYPDQKHINQESFSRFQAFLDEVRNKTTAPPRAGLHSYRFYLKTKEEGRFHEVKLELRTTGGDCRNVVQRSLSVFFKDCGLPDKFQWAEGDWQYSLEEEMAERRRQEEYKEEY